MIGPHERIVHAYIPRVARDDISESDARTTTLNRTL